MQLFITVTFEVYYECRLLAVVHNRMDRYIALRFKGLGASKVNMSEIRETDSEGVYIVRSQSHDGVEYEVDMSRWHCTCTCTIVWTGKPTGEPCKHQAAVGKKYNLSSINYIPYFSSEGRYAVLAVGVENAGDKSFLNDGNLSNDFSGGCEKKIGFT